MKKEGMRGGMKDQKEWDRTRERRDRPVNTNIERGD